MTSLNNQELQVLQAFSNANIPESIFKSSNISELVNGMLNSQATVKNNAARLENLRQDVKDGNFFGNWLNDRKDKVQDAQIDLNRSIGLLTEQSSQLLIFNTILSKALGDQQEILLQQQNQLKQQTDDLEATNLKILDQQKELENQQKEINKANQGLLEAKGVTQEQAQKLVGCVQSVSTAEKKIFTANDELQVRVARLLNETIERCNSELSSGFIAIDLKNELLAKQLTDKLSENITITRSDLDSLGRKINDVMEHTTHKLAEQTKVIFEKTNAQDEALNKQSADLIQQLKSIENFMTLDLSQKSQKLYEYVEQIEVKWQNIQSQYEKELDAQRQSMESSIQDLTLKIDQHDVKLLDYNFIQKSQIEKVDIIVANLSGLTTNQSEHSISLNNFANNISELSTIVSTMNAEVSSTLSALDTKFTFNQTINKSNLRRLTFALIISMIVSFGSSFWLFALLQKNHHEPEIKTAAIASQLVEVKKQDKVPSTDFYHNVTRLAVDGNWLAIDEKMQSLSIPSYAIADPKSAEDLKKSGLDLLSKNEFGKAIADLEKSYLANKNDPEVKNSLGYAELKAGRLDKSIAHLHDTLLLEPTRASAWLNLAEALAEHNDASASEGALRLAIHFARDKVKALDHLKNVSTASADSKFGTVIKNSLPHLVSIPQFAR